MPNYLRHFQPGGTFFFTVVTAERRRLFSDETARTYLRTAIRTVQAERPFEMVAIVLLPDHIHCIWTLPEDDADFPARWSCIKRHFTKQWIADHNETIISPARHQHREHGVWQKRFWEHRIRDETDLIHHVNYIHYNPLKHSLASCPHAWPWSSFHRWVKEGYYREDWLCCCEGRQPVAPDLGQIIVAGESNGVQGTPYE
ncbi:MAG TPA: transposase [Sedimentisphaerales bacterium]|nr:transposase [Sedimentisphaerales bacterium]